MNFPTNFVDPGPLLIDKFVPAFAFEARDALDPIRIELASLIGPEKFLAAHAIAVGKPEQTAFVTDEPFIDVVELLHQRFDTRRVQRQALHVLDHRVTKLLGTFFLLGRQRVVGELTLDVLVLQLAQLLLFGGDVIESFEHFRLELGLHGGKRKAVFEVFVLVEIFLGLKLPGLIARPAAAF